MHADKLREFLRFGIRASNSGSPSEIARWIWHRKTRCLSHLSKARVDWKGRFLHYKNEAWHRVPESCQNEIKKQRVLTEMQFPYQRFCW